MRPLVIDSSVWIEWLRGNQASIRDESKGRILFLPAVIPMELLSGAHTRKSFQLVSAVIESFERNRRLLIPTLEDYRKAGSVLADLGWSASKKSNDVLIGVCARRIGAEIWTCDYSDYSLIAKALQLIVRKI